MYADDTVLYVSNKNPAKPSQPRYEECIVILSKKRAHNQYEERKDRYYAFRDIKTRERCWRWDFANKQKINFTKEIPKTLHSSLITKRKEANKVHLM